MMAVPSAVPSHAIPPDDNGRGTDSEFIDSPTTSLTPLNMGLLDETYSTLKWFLTKTGRGRPPALPVVALNNRLLIQLYYLRDECEASWKEVHKLFINLFPEETEVTINKLNHRITAVFKKIPQQGLQDYLSSLVEFFPVSDILSRLGLSREVLLKVPKTIDLSSQPQIPHPLICH